MSESTATTDVTIRACAVVPTHNNPTTIAAVVTGLQRVIADVIVVDDGSDEEARTILESLSGVEMVTHARNMGKGAALLSGFKRAVELGFTHAVTVDADGQHSPEDVPPMLAVLRETPHAMIIGVRDLKGAGRPLKSRILRTHSNFWVWTETGRWIADTQSGLRIYPLEPVANLRLASRKYDFEIEVLVKTVWAGTPVREVPVRASYGPGSRSQFRPVGDFALVARLNFVLFLEAMFLPAMFRRRMHHVEYADAQSGGRYRRIIRAVILQDGSGPGLLAVSVGVGVCFGILPIWGFQMMAAFAVAHVLRLSKAVVLLVSNISIPAFMPVILYASLVTGRLVLARRLDFSLSVSGLDLAAARAYLAEYLCGAVVLALAAGLAAGVVTYAVGRMWRLAESER